MGKTKTPFCFSPSQNSKQPKCVSVSLSTSDRPVARLAMPAGSSTALSTESSPTVRCLQTRPLVEETTLSTPSSQRPELASTFPEQSLSTWSPQWSMRSGLERTGNSSTQSSSSLAKRMLPTTTLVVTTPLARRLLTLSWTVFASWLTSALAFKVSSSSTHLEAVLDQDSHPC